MKIEQIVLFPLSIFFIQLADIDPVVRRYYEYRYDIQITRALTNI